jgi:hypothetical protein
VTRSSRRSAWSTSTSLTTTGAKSFTARDVSLKGSADFGRVIAQ